MKILFGTRNQSKRDRFSKLLSPLNVEVLSLTDLGISSSVKEDGKTAMENAMKKASTYYELSDIPTFSIDYSLRIDKFSEEKQPNTEVRRIWKDEREATDTELLEWFVSELEKVGGKSKGIWTTGLVLVVSKDVIYKKEFKSNTLFISKPSKVMMSGEPLNSIQYDEEKGKYKSERTSEEWISEGNRINREILEFFKKNIGD